MYKALITLVLIVAAFISACAGGAGDKVKSKEEGKTEDGVAIENEGGAHFDSQRFDTSNYQ